MPHWKAEKQHTDLLPLLSAPFRRGRRAPPKLIKMDVVPCSYSHGACWTYIFAFSGQILQASLSKGTVSPLDAAIQKTMFSLTQTSPGPCQWISNFQITYVYHLSKGCQAPHRWGSLTTCVRFSYRRPGDHNVFLHLASFSFPFSIPRKEMWLKVTRMEFCNIVKSQRKMDSHWPDEQQ